MRASDTDRKEIDLSKASSVMLMYDFYDGIVEQTPYMISVNTSGGSFTFIPYDQFLELQGNTEESWKERRRKFGEERGWTPVFADVLDGWHKFLHETGAVNRHQELVCDAEKQREARTWGMTVYD